MGYSCDFKIIRVRKVKINPDHITAKVVFDIAVGEKNGKLTIPKLNLFTTKIEHLLYNKQVFDNPLFPYHEVKEIIANMNIDLDETGSAFQIKLV